MKQPTTVHKKIRDLPIYVISLKRATERRHKIQQQLDGLGLKFEFLDATDERQGLSDAEISLLGSENLHKHDGRTNPGAIGALISHLRCYESILDSAAEQALILEDDVVFAENFVPILEVLLNLPVNFDLFHLGVVFPKDKLLPWIGAASYPLNFWRRRKVDLSSLNLQQEEKHYPKEFGDDRNYYIGPVAGNAYGVYCYLISREGCKFSLKHYKALPYNIDSLMNVSGIPNRFALVPSIGIHPYEDSFIDYDKTLTLDTSGNASTMDPVAGQQGGKLRGESNGLRKLFKSEHPDWAISLMRTFCVLFLTTAIGYYRRVLKQLLLRKA